MGCGSEDAHLQKKLETIPLENRVLITTDTNWRAWAAKHHFLIDTIAQPIDTAQLNQLYDLYLFENIFINSTLSTNNELYQWANLHHIRLIELPNQSLHTDQLGHFIADHLRQRSDALYQLWGIMLAGTLVGMGLAVAYFRYKRRQIDTF